MRTLREWPALAAGPDWPDKLKYSRAVWGKVHAARSDYRWIALSVGQVPEMDLHKQFVVGVEDMKEETLLWRNLNGRCHAVSCYVSRADDASARGSFLEKQVLSWDTGHLPAALGALVLLPRVATLTDAIWWDHYKDDRWSNPNFYLQIELSEHQPLAVLQKDLAAAVEQGIEEIRSSLEIEHLQSLYAALLAGCKPAFLTGLRQPLSAAALAALLLPLHRDRADQISLAAWVPSGRAFLEDLRKLWDVVALPPRLADLPAGTLEVDRGYLEEGRRLAAMLFGQEPVSGPRVDLPPMSVEEKAENMAPPPRKAEKPFPGHTIHLEAPSAGAPMPLKRLHEFAVATDRRWIEAGALGDFKPGQIRYEASPIPCWIRVLDEQRPTWVDETQWAVKLDLLRCAALVLHPQANVDLPVTGKVPALYFAPSLSTIAHLDLLGNLGTTKLQAALDQTLKPGRNQRAVQMKKLVERWRSQTNRRDVDIQGMIGRLLASRPA